MSKIPKLNISVHIMPAFVWTLFVKVCVTFRSSDGLFLFSWYNQTEISLSCDQVFHSFCFPYIFDWPSVFYWYALLAGSIGARTVRCVVTATTPSVSLRFAKTTATSAETATEGVTRKACTRLVLLPVTNWEHSNINVSSFHCLSSGVMLAVILMKTLAISAA